MILKKENAVPITDTVLSDLTKKLKNNSLKFHQFYNNEISAKEYGFIQYMLNFKNSSSQKILNKTYYDIETYVNEHNDFTDPIKVIEPINSIALYNNIKNESYIICYITDCKLKDHDKIKKGILHTYKEACNKKEAYIIKDMKINIFIEDDEKMVHRRFHKLLNELNTLMLIGFNSSQFDDAYIFNRAEKLFGETGRNDMVSDFGILKKYGDKSFEIPDYLLVDILKLYKPVDQGGGGLGRSLPDYKLNTICQKELKLEKLDLSGGFRETYINDIINYLTYNLLDTLLTFKLDQKLQFLESTFDLAQYNNATMGATITGRSFIYTYRNDLMYYRNNQLIRTKKFSREVLYETETKD